MIKKPMKLPLFFLSGLLLVSASQAAPLDINEGWRSVSDPLLMSSTFNRHFRHLPVVGSITDLRKFWSGDYWPSKSGSINHRWNGDRRGFDLNSPTLAMARTMSAADLMKLAPSEKYSLLIGDYTYALKTAVEKLANPKAQDWEGICHGWAPASMNHSEPTPKIATNPDGISIPFGSSDIKALLSYYYAVEHKVPTTHQTGLRCDRDNTYEPSATGSCNFDLNAGAFHIILTNRIGILRQGFLADLDRFREVWNFPIYAYESKVTAERKPHSQTAPGTVKVLVVETTVSYISESETNQWGPINGTDEQILGQKKFKYRLELNATGEIIGGDWASEDRPDFLWLVNPPETFLGPFEKLRTLLND